MKKDDNSAEITITNCDNIVFKDCEPLTYEKYNTDVSINGINVGKLSEATEFLAFVLSNTCMIKDIVLEFKELQARVYELERRLNDDK